MVQLQALFAETKRRPGRPRNPENRSALLAAGKTLMLDHGVDVKVEAIADKAGVARGTFYNYFQDKESFIDELLHLEASKDEREEKNADAAEKPLAQALNEFGLRYLHYVNKRQLLKWNRLLGAIDETYPQLMERMFLAGPGREYGQLARIIQLGMDTGKILACEPAQAVGDIVGLWHGTVILQISLGARPPLSDEEIHHRVRRGVELFLYLYEPMG